jgi:hypothetical protein
MCALLGVMVAGQALALNIRYVGSGDYLDPAGWQGGVIPGTNDTARFNYENNTVTLAGAAPLVRNFQAGVDESGGLEVNAGGILNTTGIGGNSTVGNNPNAGIIGRLTVNAGGEVNVTNVLFVGANATGIVTNDGGIIRISTHLWGGSGAAGVGNIYIANGGSISVGGNIGLGTVNASTPSGGKCSVYVQEGGVLNLTTITPVTSIQPNSVLDISGSGIVTKTGDFTAVMSAYTNAGRITAYGGAGTVGIDYDTMNAGKTTLFAIAPLDPPPTDVVWNPAANPSGTGKWNESANWTGGQAPVSITKVNFNVEGAIPCTVTNPAVANYLVMGENGPGGTLIITNGGSLVCSSALDGSVIGANSNAVMKIETGGSASFDSHLWIGLDPGSDGTLTMNGGTVSVAGMFGLGRLGGKGTVQINGGTLNLAQWDYFAAIQGESVLDVSGTGTVVINGNQQFSVENFILTGQITNRMGTALVVDYNNIRVGKTTIYPLGVYIAPEQVDWNPALNLGDTAGLWNVSSNWTGGVGPSNVTIVRFNVLDAIPCTVTNAAVAKYVTMGQGGPGGTLIITNGGSLTCSADNWTAIGRNNTALMIVETGGTVSLGEHLWIGLDATGDGTLIMNGGTVSVAGMFGLGWNGGKGTAQINGGILNLAQWHPTDSIKTATSLLHVAGPGKVVINGNHTASIANYVSAGKITAAGGTVYYGYDSGVNKTTISNELLPAPRQSITAVSVIGGTVSITYQTTDQHTYYLERSPTLSPPAWTPVVGSTNAATGAPVTFAFPAGAGPEFYRTVSITP